MSLLVTKDVDVLRLDDGAWGGPCVRRATWQITAEYCGNGKTRFEVTKDGRVEFEEYNSPEFRRDTTRILEKVSKLPNEVKFFLPPRWF